MTRSAAIDHVDLIGCAAAAHLCTHEPEGACLRCTVSTVSNLWRALDVLRVTDWPAAATPRTEPHGASLS